MYISGKRKTREVVGPLWKQKGDLAIQDVEKAEILSDSLCLSLHQQEHQPHGTGRMKNCPV